MKKIEQTERRYRAEREELLRRVNGLDSGVLWPSAPGPSGNEGNRVFGNGASVGIGSQRARDGTVVGADKVGFVTLFGKGRADLRCSSRNESGEMTGWKHIRSRSRRRGRWMRRRMILNSVGPFGPQSSSWLSSASRPAQ